MECTYNVEVEAETREEAIAKARYEWEAVDCKDMDYADQDVDAWIEK